jgi:hypothetical protein
MSDEASTTGADSDASSAYVSDTQTVTIDGESFVVSKFKTKKLLKLVKPLVAVQKSIEALKTPDGNVSLIDVLDANPEAVLAILGVSVGKDQEWAGELDPVDAVTLLAAIFKVNPGFFSRMKQLTALIAGK